MSAPEPPNSDKLNNNSSNSNNKSVKSFPKADPEKLNIIFSTPSNCQFYFGIDGKKKKEDPVNLSETEKMQSLCAELKIKVAELETTNALLLRRVLTLEDRLDSLEDGRIRKPPVRPHKSAETVGRGAGDVLPTDTCESTECSSDGSAITGDVIFLEEHIMERPGIRTATPSPALSATGNALTPFKIVAKPGNQVNGVTALAMSKTYPGKLSCVFEIVNWIETPMTNAHCVVKNGVIESVPQPISIAKAFGIWENGPKLHANFSYRVGPVRIAFGVYIDESTSYFRIGFVSCHDPGPALTEALEASDKWIDGKLGQSGNGKINSSFGNVRITGTLAPGNKTLLEISVSKIS